MRRSPVSFVSVFTSSFIVSINQPPGITAKFRRPLASSKDSWYRRTLLVWLPGGVFQQYEKLALRFFRPAAITQNAVSHVNLGPKNTVQKGLD